VTDPFDMCPYIEEGWVYSWYMEEDEVSSLSVPNGGMYDIVDEETYYMYYYTEEDYEEEMNYYDDENEETYYDE
jgi:hypothetical protein